MTSEHSTKNPDHRFCRKHAREHFAQPAAARTGAVHPAPGGAGGLPTPTLRPFGQALEFIRAFKFTSRRAWTQWSASGDRPSDIPGAPHTVYKDAGWRGWGHFLGYAAVEEAGTSGATHGAPARGSGGGRGDEQPRAGYTCLCGVSCSVYFGSGVLFVSKSRRLLAEHEAGCEVHRSRHAPRDQNPRVKRRCSPTKGFEREHHRDSDTGTDPGASEVSDASDGGRCTVCLGGGEKPLLIQRGCGCHSDNGLTHVACLAQFATRKAEQEGDWHCFVACDVCKERFAGAMQHRLAQAWWARVAGNGADDAGRLAAAGHLADSYIEQGRHGDAAELQEEVLAVETRLHGKEHPVALAAGANLAATYRRQGDNAAAAALQEVVLAAKKRVLGEDHHSTLVSAGSLAFTYCNQGKYAEAARLQEGVLAAKKRAPGKGHPDTLAAANILALTHSNQGEYAKAEALQFEVLAVRTQVLGKEHSATLTSAANLAVAYRDQGKLAEAAAVQRGVLAARKRVLGEEHLDTLGAANNLAATCCYQGDYTEAANLQARVLSVATRVLGEDHPHTLTAASNLASTYSGQGKHAEAAELEEEVFAMRTRVLGPTHAHTLVTAGNLAVSYSEQGMHGEAAELREHVLKAEKLKREAADPSTCAAARNVAGGRAHQGPEQEDEATEVMVRQKHAPGTEKLSAARTAGSFAGARSCRCCGITETPMWRKDGDGGDLCNACGMRWIKYRKQCPMCQYVAAPSPPSSSLHTPSPDAVAGSPPGCPHTLGRVVGVLCDWF